MVTENQISIILTVLNKGFNVYYNLSAGSLAEDWTEVNNKSPEIFYLIGDLISGKGDLNDFIITISDEGIKYLLGGYYYVVYKRWQEGARFKGKKESGESFELPNYSYIEENKGETFFYFLDLLGGDENMINVEFEVVQEVECCLWVNLPRYLFSEALIGQPSTANFQALWLEKGHFPEEKGNWTQVSATHKI